MVRVKKPQKRWLYSCWSLGKNYYGLLKHIINLSCQWICWHNFICIKKITTKLLGGERRSLDISENEKLLSCVNSIEKTNYMWFKRKGLEPSIACIHSKEKHPDRWWYCVITAWHTWTSLLSMRCLLTRVTQRKWKDQELARRLWYNWHESRESKKSGARKFS